jgi:hypothetical protein
MKFNVTHNALGTYDVHLHWETKEKIKKVLLYTSLAAVSVATAVVAANNAKNTELDTE